MLRLTVWHCRLNPQFKMDVHNVAVSDKAGSVVYDSGNSPHHHLESRATSAGSNGANGGIAEGDSRSGLAVEAVRLAPFLRSHYSRQFMDNICFLKMDTEGHDVVILDDLSEDFRPPVIWIEWLREYQFFDREKLILEVRAAEMEQTSSPAFLIRTWSSALLSLLGSSGRS